MAESSSSNRNSRTLEVDQAEVAFSPERATSDGQFQEYSLQVSDGFDPRSNQTRDGLTVQPALHQSQSIHSHPATNSTFASSNTSSTPGRSKADEATDSFALQHDGQSQLVGGEPSRQEKSGGDTVLGHGLNHAYTPQAGSSGSYVGDGFNSLVPEGYGLGADQILPGTVMAHNQEGNHRNVAAPQHPYALYPQNTLLEDNSISPLSPVSFGLSGPHQRSHGQQSVNGVQAQSVLGLDDQLPPYTRYPSSQPRINTAEQGNSAAGDSGSPDDVFALGESEIPQQSINNSQSQITTHSAFSDTSQQRLHHSEKPANSSELKKLWIVIRKKRVCGGRLPLWVLLLISVIIILVLTLVVGVVVGKRTSDPGQRPRGPARISTIYATTTTTYDASLLVSPPTDLPRPLPGTYLLTLGDADPAVTNCLADDQQASAWSCNLSVREQPQIQIQVTPASAHTPDLVKISGYGMRTGPVKYGTQPPSMDQPHQLSVMVDLTESHAGPAYVFQASYNKTVILREDEFNNKRKFKRAIEDSYVPQRSTVLQPNDRPWFCYWNNTILEGFMFVKDVPIPDQNPTTTTTTTSSQSLSTRTSATSTASTDSAVLTTTFPTYPKLFKLGERRDPEIRKEHKPYCQQMRVLDDMNIVSVNKPDSDELMIVYLTETDPTGVGAKSKRNLRWPPPTSDNDDDPKMTRRSYDAGHCLCEWSNR